MLELLNTFSLSQIFIFIVLFALAIKGIISFYDWGFDRMRKFFNKEIEEDKEKNELKEQIQKSIEQTKLLMENQQEMSNNMKSIISSLELVIESDMTQIKSMITEKYFYFTKKGEIDYKSLDTLEHLYSCYEKEGGNSFVHSLMEELRRLPKKE